MDCFDNRSRKNPVIPEPDYKELMKLTHFSRSELKDIFGRYEDLASETEGTIDKASFLSISELQCCPMLSLIFDKEVIQSGKGVLGFDDFVIIVDVLSKSTPVEEKAKYLFELVKDPTHSHITLADYTILMKELSAASQLPPRILENMVEHSWKSISVNGGMDLAQFRQHLSSMELHAAMTAEFL